MKGFIGHTDRSWLEFLAERRVTSEVNFWRPAGRAFKALRAGEPFFFRLKAPINRIGGFGLFARSATVPAWRAWELFGQANGVETEGEFARRLSGLARRPVRATDAVGAVAITNCTFFAADDRPEVPSSFNPQNLSGSVIDLDAAEGRELWQACLSRATPRDRRPDWVSEGLSRERGGTPQVTVPRLGQGSFRLAVLEAYSGRCAATGEQAPPAVEAAHIHPWADGGAHDVSNGLALRRDLHRMFDLGYISVDSDHRVLVSPAIKAEFGGGGTWEKLEGVPLRLPTNDAAMPSKAMLAWHRDRVFRERD